MKLKRLEIPTFSFRQKLPDFLLGLGPDDCESVFVEINGRIGGSLNIKLVADLEALGLKAAIMDTQRNDAEGADKLELALSQNQQIGQEQYGVIYDNCVVSWETNICGEDGEILTPTRENFIGLAGVKIPELADVFEAFTAQIKVATDLVTKADGDEIKK